MRPVVLELKGDYWDSQVYAGKLFLFTGSGSFLVVDWDGLVADLSINQGAQDEFVWAFARNDVPQRAQFAHRVPYERRIKVEQGAFESLALEPWHISKTQLRKRVLYERDVPTPFPHSDSHFYNFDLFVAGRSGLYRVDSAGQLGESELPEAAKLWDAPTHHVATSLATVAVAAGDEGLWQGPANSDRTHSWLPPQELARVAKDHCNWCAWMYFSVYGSSLEAGGFLARFGAATASDDRWTRAFQDVLPGEELVGPGRYSWARRNRLCMVDGASIQMFRYKEVREESDYTVTPFSSVELDKDPGLPLRVEIAPFGLVAEFESSFFVATNNGEIIELPARPVRWRCFPRAKHYFDQLHVVYERQLRIFSFVEDTLLRRSGHTIGSSIPNVSLSHETYDQYKVRIRSADG